MKRRLLSGFILLSCGFFAWTLPGCGSSNFALLTIIPEGPTVVRTDDTLQFTASRADVTWSVQGGAANGTIDGNGLYTPPATIPVASPSLTILATSSDGQVAMGLIDLRTRNQLVFGEPQPVNDTVIPNGASMVNLILQIGIDDLVSVRLGSVQVDSTWRGLNGSLGNVFFSQNLDFAGFLPEVNVGNDATNNQNPTSLTTDSQENPGILFTTQTGGGDPTQVAFLRSEDQGSSFETATFLAASSEQQSSGASAIDQADRIHAVFVEEDSSTLTTPEDVFYVRSEDGGETWSAPQPVSATADTLGQDDVFFPHLAVDPLGTHIYVCWVDSDSQEILFSTSADGGVVFSTPVPLTENAGAGNCRVAVGPAAEVLVAYSEDTDGDGEQNIFLIKSTNQGNDFSAPVPVNVDPTGFLGSPLAYMAVDSLGRIDVVWSADLNESGSPSDLMYARSLNGGGTFSDDVPVFSGADDSFILPTGLIHDSAGRLYLQFVAADTTDHDIFLLVAE